MFRRSGGTTERVVDTTRSPTRISPPSGRRKPAKSWSVVVLPQPEGPSSAITSPFSTSRSMSWRATVSPYPSRSWEIWIPLTVGLCVRRASGHVPTHEAVRRDDDHERDQHHEDPHCRNRLIVPRIGEVEDHRRDHMRLRCEKENGRRQLA